MAGLKKYAEWMSRGRKTGRVAYVLDEWKLPEPRAGAEWAADNAFNAADELLRDPAMKGFQVGDPQWISGRSSERLVRPAIPSGLPLASRLRFNRACANRRSHSAKCGRRAALPGSSSIAATTNARTPLR